MRPSPGRIGLVAETVDDDRLLPRALELARPIDVNGAFGVWMTKPGAWANLEASGLHAALELETARGYSPVRSANWSARPTRFTQRKALG